LPPRNLLLQLAFGIIIIMLVGMLFSFHLLDIEHIPTSLMDSHQADSLSNIREDKPVVPVGVISRYAPYLIYEGYQPIVDYLTEQSDFRYVLVLGNTYQDAAEKLLNKEVDVAFLGTQIYLEKSIDNAIVPVLAPLNEDGQPYFHSIIITLDSSPIQYVEDIEKYSIAFPSKSSFSGKQMKQFLSTQYNLDLSTIPIQHFDHHQSVVYQVLKGNFMAGVIKERVLHEFTGQGIRTVISSPPIPASPIVMRSGESNPAVSEFVRLLLALDVGNPDDKALMATWDSEFANGFAEVDASNYENLRDLFPSLSRRNEK